MSTEVPLKLFPTEIDALLGMVDLAIEWERARSIDAELLDTALELRSRIQAQYDLAQSIASVEPQPS